MPKKVVRTKKAVKPKKVNKTKSPKKTLAKKKVSKVTKKPKKTAKKTTAKKAPATKKSTKKKVLKVVNKIKKSTKKTTEKKEPAKKATPSKVKTKEKKPTKKVIATKPKEPTKAPILPKKKTSKVSEATQSAHVTVVSQILSMSGLAPYQPKKTEEYMSETMQAHFRKILQAWKHQLMEEVDRTVHHMKDEAANFPDPSDRATQEEEFNLELRTRDRERKLIKKIDDSLSMIAEGSYGFCDACGVEIGLRRLEVRPTANLCVDCKTLDEIREKQQGS